MASPMPRLAPVMMATLPSSVIRAVTARAYHGGTAKRSAPNARSLHGDVAPEDSVVFVLPGRHLEARIAGEEAVAHDVFAGSEVRIERELVLVDDVVPGLPQGEAVLAPQGLVVGIEAAVLPLDVHEGLPLRFDGGKNLVIEANAVFARGHDVRNRRARGVGDVPSEGEQHVLEVGLHAVPDGGLFVEDEIAV